MKIDVHIHLVATGCQCSQCYLSESLRRRYTVRLMKYIHKISDKELATTIDFDWPKRVSQLVATSRFDKGVVLGFDGVYESARQSVQSGEKNAAASVPVLAQKTAQNAQSGGQSAVQSMPQDASKAFLNLSKSQLIIPDWRVYEITRTYPNLLPGPSINPLAPDALERVDQAVLHHAALIKWLPSVQNFNPADPKILPFYEKLQATGIPLLSHCGGERTFASLAPEFNHIRLLETALKMGVKVICAHSATSILGANEPNQLPDLEAMLKKYENLWVDNSGLCNPSRFHHVSKLVKNSVIHERTLYGSDFPVPSHAFYYLRQLGFKQVRELEREKNLLDKDARTKELLGYDEATLTRAALVLNLPKNAN